MSRKYINLEEAAKQLGITPDALTELRSNNKISAYRDGADWKFKTEDIDRLATTLQTGDATIDFETDEFDADDDELTLTGELSLDDASDSVLLSEQELGESSDTTSSTIIGDVPAVGGGSDVHLADEPGGESPSDLTLQPDDSDIGLAGASDILGSGEGSDLTLGESEINLAGDDEPGASPSELLGESALDLSGDDDDDLVLGDTGDSDITLGAGDSGISLIDPVDSGLSLEEPLELGGSNIESFELGEDDMISLDEEADLEGATQLKADDDFLLQPMEDADDASDSGSQVIALDSEDGMDDTANTVLGGGVPTMATMLEEDLGAAPGAMAMTAAGTAPIMAPEAAPEKPEYPYSVWNVMALFGCIIFLILGGMMTYDLMRNMWSWEGEYALNSPLMDGVLRWFESK
jgi:excisionase family DNA binding protein